MSGPGGSWSRARRALITVVLGGAGLALAVPTAAAAGPGDTTTPTTPPTAVTATTTPVDSTTTAATTTTTTATTTTLVVDDAATATGGSTVVGEAPTTTAGEGPDARTAAAESAPVTTTPEQVLATVVAAAAAPGYYQPAYSDAIYEVAGGSARALSYEEWLAAGSPAPQPAPTSYVGYAWAPGIYAVNKWGDADSTWQWERLSYDQWRRAGSPAPTPVSFVPGSYFYKWATSSELFVEAPDGVNHKLSWDEWAASGFQPYVDRSNEGFVKLSWSDAIARMPDLARGVGGPIGFAEWRSEDFPTPLAVQRVTGDRFVQYVGDPRIYYSGPTLNRRITYNEWVAAGSPAPSVEMPPLPANSGSGRRVVYDRSQQRVWAVEADGRVVKTHLVSGRTREPYAGTYQVYSRSMYTWSTENVNVKWRYMVRFAYGPQGGRIGFHEIPNKNGVPMQSYSQLGQPLSGGCVRQTTEDAVWMWNWAGLGTTVVVL